MSGADVEGPERPPACSTKFVNPTHFLCLEAIAGLKASDYLDGLNMLSAWRRDRPPVFSPCCHPALNDAYIRESGTVQN